MMYAQRPSHPSLKRSVSEESQSSYASAATTVSRSSSKLLFGEIPLTPATTVDGRSTRSNSYHNINLCALVMSTNSTFLRFWETEAVRENVLAQMDHEDLPNFRLVCHDFCTRAAPYLFESLTVTFKPSTFTKPARMEALSRVGRHVKTLTFHMPHDSNTSLPPIIDPDTGAEKQFLYEPQVQMAPHIAGQERPPKYGSTSMTNLLIQQYPPVFHAATNVPAFITAFNSLPNLQHLKISCPGIDHAPRHRRTAVDYALISVRIAVERAPLYSLSTLSLLPIHPGGLLYLTPISGFGSTSSSSKRWSQIRRLSICMDSIPSPTTSSTRNPSQSISHLRILHAYLRTLSPSLTRLFFRWKGPRGPSPLSLSSTINPTTTTPPSSSHSHSNNQAMISDYEATLHPSLRSTPSNTPTSPIKFPRLEYLDLENAHMSTSCIAAFIRKHRRTLRSFNFEDVKLEAGGCWDDALEPLTWLTGGEEWKRGMVEVMDVPIVLSPTPVPGNREPRVMGPLGGCGGGEGLFGEVVGGREEEAGFVGSRQTSAFSRWLSKGGSTSPKVVQVVEETPHSRVKRKENGGFRAAGSEHVKRFLRGSMLRGWK